MTSRYAFAISGDKAGQCASEEVGQIVGSQRDPGPADCQSQPAEYRGGAAEASEQECGNNCHRSGRMVGRE